MAKEINWQKFRDEAAVKILTGLTTVEEPLKNYKNAYLYNPYDILIDKAITYANALTRKLKSNPFKNEE